MPEFPAHLRPLGSMRALLFILLIVLSLPMLLTGKVGVGLVGHTPPSFPAWGAARWFNGSWQGELSSYLSEQFGYRNDFVRTNNGKDYYLFGEIHANLVVEGKEGYLYEEEYLQAVTGQNAADSASFARLGQEMAFVRDSLAERGVAFLVVMAPGKGSYFPEYRPEPYDKLPVNPVNELNLLRTLRQHGIEHINLNQWFRELKDTVRYPLFPQKGIHYTEYAQVIVTDSLVKYLEQRLSIDMPDVVIDSVEVSAEQRGVEADIFRGMNLPTEPSGYPLGYPKWHVGNPEKPQPKVLFVGDSFFWNPYINLDVSSKFFGNGDFYYYFSRLMRYRTDQGDMANITLPDVLYEHDAVVLFETEHHYHAISNGFLSATVEAFLTPKDKIPKRKVEAMINRIKSDPEWYAFVKKTAEEKGLALDEALYDNAEYMLLEEMKREAFQ